jgi:hypothetical protein
MGTWDKATYKLWINNYALYKQAYDEYVAQQTGGQQ